MKPSIIIVPGLDAPKWKFPFNFLIALYCWYFELDTEKGNNWLKFQEYLAAKDILKISILGGLTWFSDKQIVSAAKKLARLIDEELEGEIILFGYSLGTSVIEEAVKNIKNAQRVSKIVCVASPHRSKTLEVPTSIKVINIYSETDTYLDFANQVLYGKGYKELDGAKNIRLDNLKHSGFSEPKLYDFYFQAISQA